MTDSSAAALPDPERLASEIVWLRRVAGALLGDGAGAGPAVDADDLVQDASLAALEHLPAGLVARRGWLAQVLRSHERPAPA